MHRSAAWIVLVLALTAAPDPAWAAPRSPRPEVPSRGVLADRDGDRVDDRLEGRLIAAPGRPQAVVVVTDGSVSVGAARRSIGRFAVSRRLPIIHGFSARLAPDRIRALARVAGVLRIDLDGTVRATMDSARADLGVDGARTAFGLTGAGVDECILDTGVDPTHEQLDSKAIVWRDLVNGRTTPYDDHGHGTHVASIAVGDGAGGASAARYAGVAPAAGLWAGKVLNAQGSGTTSGIVAGIDWCAGSPEVDVISMSLGSSLPSDGSDALSVAADNAVAAGKVVVVAAGNAGDAPDSIGAPGAAADAITVGAVAEWSGAPGAPNASSGVYLAHFSSRGPTHPGDIKPDIVSPGVTITAAQANTTAGYATFSGTSMATPFVAGAAALALQAAPGWSPTDVQMAMEGTAEDYGPAGKDPDWGAGAIDVLALAGRASGATAEQTFPTHVHLSGTVPDGGQWSHTFDVVADDLDVPIAATLLIGGQCRLSLPGFGCLDAEWSPDLDVKLFDPTGAQIAISQCMAGSECGLGRQETIHVMPTVAGTYELRAYAYLGSPNDGLGGDFGLDLSTGPVGSAPPPPPPPPAMHVGDLDRTSVSLSSKTWRARVTIRVHDGSEALLPGVGVTGRWGNSVTVTCTTGASGACTVTRDLKRSQATVTFRVTGLSDGTHDYLSAANHDADGDSNGTSITVTRP
jgi:serine protease AprX